MYLVGDEIIKYNKNITLYDVERIYIIQAVKYYNGNKTQAANALGITIKTLYNKLHDYGLFNKITAENFK